jgi:hypothetical protein
MVYLVIFHSAAAPATFPDLWHACCYPHITPLGQLHGMNGGLNVCRQAAGDTHGLGGS